MSNRRIVALLFAGALALRVAWVLAVDRNGLAFNDTFFYHQAATSLADGEGYEWLGEPTSRWPPVYPFLLGAIYAVVGAHEVAAELFNAVVGAVAAPLTYLCGLRLFGRREGLVAGAIVAVMPGQIFFTDVLLAETLYTTLLLTVLALALYVPRGRWWAAALVGLAVGVAAETRGEGLLLLLIPVVVWWRPRLREVALLAAGVLVVVVPWTVRNAVEMRAFVPVSTNGAQTLWSGHNEGAYGGPSYSNRGPGAKAVSPREEELETSRRLRREAVEFALSHPLAELSLVPRKVAWLMRGDSAALAQWVQPGARGLPPAFTEGASVPLSNAADLFFYALLAATLAALVLMRRAPVLWLLMGAALVLYGLVLYGNYRYRVPLEPIMALAASSLLVAIWGLRRPPRSSLP